MDALWAHHHATFRDPRQVVAQWGDAPAVDPRLLRFRVRGRFWDVLAQTGATLLVTREYEHLALALCAADGTPHVSYLPVPHPSGLAVDRRRGVVHLASTRNPNQLFELRPATGAWARTDVDARAAVDAGRPLVPVRSSLYAGSLYLHDLALIGGVLHANAVGHNAVVRFGADGAVRRAWWPRSIERGGARGGRAGGRGTPEFGRNRLQLNSIGAGATPRSSFFSASAATPGRRVPGDPLFPVDRRGVIFSGATREPVVTGLTRPHSVRLRGRALWVDDSGYGTVGVCEDGRYLPVARLPGWTRGLCFCGGRGRGNGTVAFVGTSRVIPRFRAYAPGLDADESVCGVHALDPRTGAVLGSLVWPYGNQVFAIDWIPARVTRGFPFALAPRGSRGARHDDAARVRDFFYTFTTDTTPELAP